MQVCKLSAPSTPGASYHHERALYDHEGDLPPESMRHTLSGSNRVAVYGLLTFFTLLVYLFFLGGIDRAPRWFISVSRSGMLLRQFLTILVGTITSV